MAFKIVWSSKARVSLYNILIFLNERTSSNQAGDKLFNTLQEKLILLSKYPESGKITSQKNVRIKYVSYYGIYYKIHSDQNQIVILAILDLRRDNLPS